MGASATVLSNNVLMRGNRDSIKITPMKLQKLLYYVCCEYVQRTGVSPISESFEVWQYGPVLPSVYGEFKPFRTRPITEYAKDARGRAYRVSESENPKLASVLDSVWSKYKYWSATDLSRQTHKENSGWYRAFSDNRSIITVEDMSLDASGI